MQTPNRGTRPYLNLGINQTAPSTQLSGGPSSPIVSPLAGGMTPSVHQQPMPPQFGGNLGLQQPPMLRLERARPNEVRNIEILLHNSFYQSMEGKTERNIAIQYSFCRKMNG